MTAPFPIGTRVVMTPEAKVRFPKASSSGQVVGRSRLPNCIIVRGDGNLTPRLWLHTFWQKESL